jgi:hypothetical protein
MTLTWHDFKPSAHAFAPEMLEASLRASLTTIAIAALQVRDPTWRRGAVAAIDRLIQVGIGTWAGVGRITVATTTW